MQKNAAEPATVCVHPLSGVAFCTPSGAFSAVAAALLLSTPVCTILASTVLRRWVATVALVNGSYPVGFSTMPASRAAWGSVSFAAEVLK